MAKADALAPTDSVMRPAVETSTRQAATRHEIPAAPTPAAPSAEPTLARREPDEAVAAATSATDDPGGRPDSRAATGSAPLPKSVQVTIGRIDISISGRDEPKSTRLRTALSDAARLRRAGVRRL
jgi:hypothetical protein